MYKALSIKDKEIDIYIDDTTEYLIIGKKIDEVHGINIFDERTAIKITAEDFDEINKSLYGTGLSNGKYFSNSSASSIRKIHHLQYH